MNYSDIDWRQSVAYTENQHYVEYGLSKEEIGFIEGMIKVMGVKVEDDLPTLRSQAQLVPIFRDWLVTQRSQRTTKTSQRTCLPKRTTDRNSVAN